TAAARHGFNEAVAQHHGGLQSSPRRRGIGEASMKPWLNTTEDTSTRFGACGSKASFNEAVAQHPGGRVVPRPVTQPPARFNEAVAQHHGGQLWSTPLCCM